MLTLCVLAFTYIGLNRGEQTNKTILVAIGNPGAGKSTILNCIAGQLLFKSGISIGNGLTFELVNKSDKHGNVYVDTPGIADYKHRKKAGEDISKLLKEGGRLKMIMFVRETDGRVSVEDVTTMQMILEAAPEVGPNFGIIINKVGATTMKKLNETRAQIKFLSYALFGMEKVIKNFKPIDVKYLFLQKNEELDEKENKFIPLEELRGLNEFLEGLPIASLTPGIAADIKVETYQEMVNEFKAIIQGFEYEKAEMEVRIEKLTNKLEHQRVINEQSKLKSAVELGRQMFINEQQKAINEEMKLELANERERQRVINEESGFFNFVRKIFGWRKSKPMNCRQDL